MRWHDRGCCNRGTRTRSMGGYRSMRTKGWPDSWPTSTGEIAGGCFAEVEAVKEELLETRRALGEFSSVQLFSAESKQGVDEARNVLTTWLGLGSAAQA